MPKGKKRKPINTGKAHHAPITRKQITQRKKAKAERERKKELAKLLRNRGPNPYSAVRYHQGFVRDQIRYTVLTGSLLSKERMEMVTSKLKTVTTGSEASTLPEIPGWAVEEISKYHDGRVYLVRYCGTEVALFFKRQLTELVPQPGEKVPEGVLQDTKEAWQRLDLLGRSAEKAHFVLTTQRRRLEEENKLLTTRNIKLDDLNDYLEKKLLKKEEIIDSLEGDQKELERKLRLVMYKPSKLHKRGKTAGNAGKQHPVTRLHTKKTIL